MAEAIEVDFLVDHINPRIAQEVSRLGWLSNGPTTDLLAAYRNGLTILGDETRLLYRLAITGFRNFYFEKDLNAGILQLMLRFPPR